MHVPTIYSLGFHSLLLDIRGLAQGCFLSLPSIVFPLRSLVFSPSLLLRISPENAFPSGFAFFLF